MSDFCEYSDELNNIKNLLDTEHQQYLQMQNEKKRMLEVIEKINNNIKHINNTSLMITENTVNQVVINENPVNAITVNNIQNIQDELNKNNIKKLLKNTFDQCLDILRVEGLTGDKALRNMSFLLILKLIEPRFGKEIDIDTYAYNFHIDDEDIELHKTKLLKIVRFSNLADEKVDNIPTNIKVLWDDILAVHPTTKSIFLKGKGFDIQYQTTYKKLINKLHSLDLSNTEYDILGEAYEDVIKDVMTCGILGQFFTPPTVKKMMIDLINPQLHDDGKIDTCCDPTMGTGGFLITYLQNILKQSKIKNIKLDWDFIKTEGLYGKELEPDTYQLAVSNMLITSGHMFENLDKGDSIREPIAKKFDNILANPPFGIKGLKYDDFQSSLKSQYTPIKTNNAVSLFIQAIIYMLKIEGKCAVVLPYEGQDLFSKTNTTLVVIREYLVKTCDLKKIICLPSGIFTNTTIKTCIFYFIKKVEGSDILETEIITGKKTKKEKGRNYKFPETYQTTNVKFYETKRINVGKENEELIKTLLVEVPIETIASNSYSLNYAEYMETKEETYSEGVVVKTLGEVCKFQNGYSFKSTDYEKQNDTNIGILQIKSIQNGFINENKITEYIEENTKYKTFEIQKGDILIALSGATTGKIGIYNLQQKSYLNQRVGKINAKTDICQKYIYYWYVCCNIAEKVLDLSQGTAQPNISTNDIANIKIPIPSIDRQTEIVKYLDFIYEKANKTSNEKIAELKQLNGFCLSNQKKFGVNDIKTIGEIFHITKGTLQSSKNIDGMYTFITASDTHKTHNIFDYDGECIMLVGGAEGSLAKAQYFKGKFIASDLLYVLIQKIENEINYRYVWYYLNFNREKHLLDDTICCGTPKRMISKDRCSNIKIPIPPLDRQKEIVEYCENNDIIIKQLEQEIENNKKVAHQFITSIVKSQNQDDTDEIQDDTDEIQDDTDEIQDDTDEIQDE